MQDLVEALAPYQEALKDDDGKSEQTSEAKDVIEIVKSEFEAKMLDDLNSSLILKGTLQKAMKFINVSITKLKKMQKQQRQQRMSLAVSLVEVEKAARGILDVLGLLTPLSYTEFLKEMKQKALARAGLGEDEVFQKIKERKMKQNMKEFERSDEIRDSLAVKGISLMDIPGKDTLWRPCLPGSSQRKPATAWRPFLTEFINLYKN